MANAVDIVLENANRLLESKAIDEDTYLSMITAAANIAATEEAAPVTETKAASTAQNTPSKRVHIQAAVSNNFSYGHITLSKGKGRRFGVWAEDVDSVIEGLMNAYAELPASVRKAAEALNAESS